MRQLIGKLLLENLSLKVISVILALLFFVMVRSEKPYLAQGTVRVSYHPPSGKILKTKMPATVQVAVQGGATRMQRFRFEDLADLNIDLSRVREGYFKFSPDLIQLPRGLKVTSIRPAGAVVRYETVSARTIPVSSTVQGQVAAGFQIVQHTVSPALVEVRGPREVVLALKALSTRPVSVEGAEATLVQRVGLMPLPPNVVARPASDFTVTVEVAPFTTQVVLGKVPVEVRGGDGKRVPLDVTPHQVEVTVTGSAQNLANISSKKVTAQLEAEGAGWDPLASVPRITGLPAGVKVVKVKPAKVTIAPGPAQGGGGAGGKEDGR